MILSKLSSGDANFTLFFLTNSQSIARRACFFIIWSIFLGKEQQELAEFDPSSEEFFNYWRKIARSNEQAYYRMFLNPPTNQIHTNEQLMLVRKQRKVEFDQNAEDKELKNISGVLVEMPLQFLKDENFHPSTKRVLSTHERRKQNVQCVHLYLSDFDVLRKLGCGSSTNF